MLKLLVKPHEWVPPADRSFPFTADEIEQLCESAQQLVASEPHTVKVGAPVRVTAIENQVQMLMLCCCSDLWRHPWPVRRLDVVFRAARHSGEPAGCGEPEGCGVAGGVAGGVVAGVV